MPSPTRPVDGAAVATDWGQAVHDYVFAPSGCLVHSGAAVTMAAYPTFRTLNLDTIDSDPGGYCDTGSDRIVIPSGGAGLYLILAQWQTDDGDSSEETRVGLMLNGSEVSQAIVNNEGSTPVNGTISWAGVLVEGDIFTFRARQNGSGARADVTIQLCILTRIGNEVGGA